MTRKKRLETRSKLNIRVVVGLAAIVALMLTFGQLFEVRVSPSSRVKGLKSVLGIKEPEPEVQDEPLTYENLAKQVTPVGGKTVLVEWGDMGKKLVDAGAIDMVKFEERYKGLSEEQKEVLLGDDLHQITFRADNIQFWTNVLWALGLTQKSKVLTEGPMVQNKEKTPIDRYASTAGWTLGTRTAMQLYNSQGMVELTEEQDELVYKVAENIFRPCCGNDTAYPDCNHGMAVLGLLSLMTSQGASEEEMYKAALAFNVYAFSSTYINTAAYFAKQGIAWADVDAKEVLGAPYSGAQGAGFIAKSVGEIPGAPKKGASCGA